MYRILSKTQIDSFDKCERYGYLKYFFLGTGVEADSRTIELAVGSAIHKGVEHLWKRHPIGVAIAQAWAQYDMEIENSFDPGTPADVVANVKQEHKDVIEAMLRLWAHVRLPALLTDFEYVMGEYKIMTQLTEDLSLLAIPDAILQAKLDGRFMNWSLKTEKSHGRIKHPSALIDTGGLTESITAAMTVGDGSLANIAGTMMEYLVVGTLDKDEPIIWHPAIRGWRRPSGTGLGSTEYAWRWEFPNVDYDPTGPKSSQKNPKTRSLKAKDGWERFEARNYPGGIDAWVTDLLARRFIPHHVDPLTELVYYPAPYVRTAGAVDSFLTQTVATQTKITEAKLRVEAGESLDAHFPMRRGNCLRYGEQYRCPYWSICFEGAGADPFNNGFVPRKRRNDAQTT